jgi:hypothetical protein
LFDPHEQDANMSRTLSNTIKFIASGALLAGINSTFAHEGHGLQGSHWHATDLWGFVAIGVVLAIAIWHGRK